VKVDPNGNILSSNYLDWNGSAGGNILINNSKISSDMTLIYFFGKTSSFKNEFITESGFSPV